MNIPILFQQYFIKYLNMNTNTNYQRILKEYNVPEGVLTEEELKLLRDGGIRDSDSQHYYQQQSYRKTRSNKGVNNVEIQALKSMHQNQLSMKEKQIQFLQSELSRRDQLIQIQRQKLITQFQFQRENLLTQLRNARARVIHTESQIPLIKQALAQVRDMLSGSIPESVYLRLRDIPQRDLPPSQWLLVNVWQMCYPFKKETQFQKKQIGKLRQQLKMTNDKQHTLLAELQHYSRLLASKDDDQKRHLLNFQNNRKSMQLQLEKCREEVELLREKGARYDELLRDYNFTKQQKELLQQKMGYYNKQQGGDKSDKNRFAEDSLARKLDLLTQDKQYLTKQNIQLLEKNKRLEDRLDRLQSQLLNQKNRSTQYLHQLMNLKTDSISSYEQRIYKEISELKQKHNLDLEATKNNLIDIYQKQIRFVKQALEQKEIRFESVERELRDRNKQYEQLLIDNRTFQRKFETDSAQLRVSLKIKTEELDRVNNIYQQTLSNLKAHKLQNEMLKQKINLLKGEFYKSEANAKDNMSSLKAQVAVLKEQLANYELIQKQIDEAVVSLSNLKPNQNNIYLNTLNSIPSSNKRRIQQALGLAQRLQAKQRQNDEIAEKLRLQQQKVEKLSDQLRIARQLLDKTNQPYSYLVGSIEQKEKEVLLLRNANRKKQQDYENIKQQYNHLKKQLEEAQNDIKRLLIKRQNIQNIQSLLVNLVSGTSSKQEIANIVDQIQEILGNTRNNLPQKKMENSLRKQQKELPLWYQKLNEKRKKN